VFVNFSSSIAIITAANEAYWRCLWQFLLSARRKGIDKEARIVVYDLGLEATTLARLRKRFPWAKFHQFDFAAYPPHVSPETQTYAWKPMVIAEAAAEIGGQLLWLDCAALFKRRDLEDVRAALARDGTYVLRGASALELRCNAFTLNVLNVPEADRKRPERPAGIIGLDVRRPAVRQLIAEWKTYALMQECIAQRTSGHNPEQALLSILLFKYERAGGLGLSRGEIDISSPAPVKWITTRNKVPNWVPVWADMAPRLYYFAYKTLDQAWLGFQQQRRMGHKAGDRPERFHETPLRPRLDARRLLGEPSTGRRRQ
jgi:hypothetical protein